MIFQEADASGVSEGAEREVGVRAEDGESEAGAEDAASGSCGGHFVEETF